MLNFIENQSQNLVFPQKHWFFHWCCFVWNWCCLNFAKKWRKSTKKTFFLEKNMFFHWFKVYLKNWHQSGSKNVDCRLENNGKIGKPCPWVCKGLQDLFNQFENNLIWAAPMRFSLCIRLVTYVIFWPNKLNKVCQKE